MNSIRSVVCCPTSYGVLCQELYNREKHSSWTSRLERNAIDGKEDTPDQIFWLIRRGEAIRPDTPISETFCWVVNPNVQDLITGTYTIC